MSRVASFVLLLLAGAMPAAAQTFELLPRFAFGLSAEHLGSDEPGFVWDTKFGGELDLLDYGRGRVTFETSYQAILGEEFKKFDPNQGNYILVGVASVRGPTLELAGVFYHQSRHLGDRANRQPVDWNMVGGRVRGQYSRNRLVFTGQADLRGAIQRTWVDYEWELDSVFRVQRGVGPAMLSVISVGGLRVLGVDGSRDRGTQYGYRAEGGVRIDGRGAAAEIFVAAERRIDPHPFEFRTVSWLTAGFRLVSR